MVANIPFAGTDGRGGSGSVPTTTSDDQLGEGDYEGRAWMGGEIVFYHGCCGDILNWYGGQAGKSVYLGPRGRDRNA